jgi:hypothetical protein
MAHFARLDQNNVVTQVVVVSNQQMLDENGFENEQLGIDICNQICGQGNWIQTSYNNNFRVRYAGIGYTYDPERDAFIAPKPFESWVLNEETFDYEAPKPYPDDTKMYVWNETLQEWDEVEQQWTEVEIPE